MSSATLLPVAKYLSTGYRPDCDYVDGMLIERNVGEKDHSKLQTAIAAWFHSQRKSESWHVFVEQRIRISASRYRVPDLCVVIGKEPSEQVFTLPPALCVEILSKDDRMRDMQDRIRDYLSMGVSEVWVIDPKVRVLWIYTSAGMREAHESEIGVPQSAAVFPWHDVLSDL